MRVKQKFSKKESYQKPKVKVSEFKTEVLLGSSFRRNGYGDNFITQQYF